MLARLDYLDSQRKSFAFESTLASRTLAPRLERLRAHGTAFISSIFGFLLLIWR